MKEDQKPAKPLSTPKTCNACGETKTWAEFPAGYSYTRKSGEKVKYAGSKCNTCQAERSRKYRQENPDMVYLANRRYELMKKYGVTMEWFDEHAKNGCEICGDHKRLCVDHDHDTDEVRGILCARCNHGLGYFDDSAEGLGRALTYLLR